jgi:hypothetical protein
LAKEGWSCSWVSFMTVILISLMFDTVPFV